MGFIRKTWNFFAKPSTRFSLGLLLGGGIFIGIAFVLVFNYVGMKATSSLEFCATTCHEMKIPYEEYKESPHYSNASGVRADCSACHVPHANDFQGMIDKLIAKVRASKDLYHHILGTYGTDELFRAARWDLANKVWKRMKARDSQECRECHAFEAMKLDDQDRSARKKHTRAMKNGLTCIDCHTGIAHEEPDEPDEEEES